MADRNFVIYACFLIIMIILKSLRLLWDGNKVSMMYITNEE
jgi:hypothetical protein